MSQHTVWKTVRVFISSTFRDMQAERDHLVRFVFPRLREELLPRRIHLVDVDLRWGVTSDQSALDVCREVIDECHPRFMCMLGGRYGWVPPGKTHSITAAEVQYGVLDRLGKHGHAFFYFRDPIDTARASDDAVDDFREPEGSENAKKLAALKQSITDAGLPVFIYSAAWEHEQKRFAKLESFGNNVYDDLIRSLKGDPDLAARFAVESNAQPDEFAEEADQMDAFIEERTAQYVTGSREPLILELHAFASADGAPNIFVLTGDPGSGKSALLAKFTRDLASHHLSSLVIPHFVGTSTGSTDLRRTLRRLCHELAKSAGNTAPLPLDLKDLITHFQKLLADAGARTRVILVFDALNQFDATDGAQWLNWLPREMSPGVRIVASVIAPADGQPEHQTLAILRNRPGTRMEKLEPLTEADALAIIEGSLRRYAKHLSPEQLAALRAKPAGRLPLYVLTALEELRTLGTYEEITDRIRTLPGDAQALFRWILTERLSRDPGFRDREGRTCGATLVGKFAACLGVSRHGLSQKELTALLDPGDPLGNVAALLRLLRPYLMRRGELLDFYHGQFRESAIAAYLDTPEKQRAAHQSVATCLQAFADPHRDGQYRDATPHALSELPHHRTRAEAWPDIIATLENIFFLEAKVTHGLAFDLAEDFTAALDALPAGHAEWQHLRLLAEALRRDIHFIERHAQDYPQGLFQCLWNSCWWFDCPEAVQHYEDGVGPARSRLALPGREEVIRVPPSEPNSTSECAGALHALLQRWRGQRVDAQSRTPWMRSLRPPLVPLGAAQLSVLRGHSKEVLSVAYSPDGLRIASGSYDETVRVWDMASGAELAVLRGHEGAVHSVAFSPDGLRIASGSDDYTVRVWDAVGSHTLAVLFGHTNRVTSVAFNIDGQRIISGSRDNTVRIWDSISGDPVAVLNGHKSMETCGAYSPDGRRIVGDCSDYTVRLFDGVSGNELAMLRGLRELRCVCFSPDGGRIVGAARNNTAMIWDATSGAEVAVLVGHDSYVWGVAYSPDGKRIATGSDDSTVRIWDAVTGEQLAVFRGHDGRVTWVAFSFDGKHIVSGSWDKTVRVWDTALRGDSAVLKGLNSGSSEAIQRSKVYAMFSPNGRHILSLGYMGPARIWDATSVAELAVIRGKVVSVAAFSPDGHYIVGISDNKLARVWSARSGAEVAVLSGHADYITDVCFSSDGRRILTGSNDRSVRLWDVASGVELLVMRGYVVSSVAFSPDGGRILSTSDDLSATIWDATNGAKLAVLNGHIHGVKGLSMATFSPDGRCVVGTAGYSWVRVWDADSGSELAVLENKHSVAKVVYSHDGQRILCEADKFRNTVQIWDAHKYESLSVIQGIGDLTAMAAGPQKYPYLLRSRRLETSVECVSQERFDNYDHPIAWLPEEVHRISTHSSGSRWVGMIGNSFAVFQLEDVGPTLRGQQPGL